MTRTIVHSELGIKLRDLRKSLKISQTYLSKKYGVALATVRLAEISGGRLSTFNTFLAEIGYMIKGQSLPVGENIGSSLNVLISKKACSKVRFSPTKTAG